MRFPLSCGPLKWFPSSFSESRPLDLISLAFRPVTLALNEWINYFCSRMHMLSIWPRLFRYGLVSSVFAQFFFLFFCFPILSHFRRKICRRHVYCARFENQLWPGDWLADWLTEWMSDELTEWQTSAGGCRFIHDLSQRCWPCGPTTGWLRNKFRFI